MNAKSRIFRSPAFWTLCAGIAIGGLAVASFDKPIVSPAIAQTPITARPIVSVSEGSMAALKAIDQSFASLAEFASPAVVHIRAESGRQTDLLGQTMPPMGGEGSGVIIRPDGYIVTNDHVVGGFDKVTVILSDGREFKGSVTRASDSDIAVVKIDAAELPTLAFADSSKARPGQLAMAIGSPFGLDNSVTIGHISAIGRTNLVPDGRLQSARFYPDLIQTDAPINMGNSGGPLINIDGQIIGINTSIYSQTGGSNGIGFAIPSNQARLIAELLITKGKIVRGAMGVVPENLKEYQRKELRLDGGAIVRDAPSDGPAGIAGIKPKDVIVKIGDVTVKNQMDLRNAMLKYEPGQKVPVEYVREGERRTAQVTLTDPKTLEQRSFNPGDRRGPVNPNPQAPKLGPEGDGPSAPQGGKARLGVQASTPTDGLRDTFNIPKAIEGAVVVSVDPNSVAARIGMKPGDVILEIDGQATPTAERLAELMQSVKIGDSKRIKFARYSKDGVSTQTLDVNFR